jgi:hypothetical protein
MLPSLLLYGNITLSDNSCHYCSLRTFRVKAGSSDFTAVLICLSRCPHVLVQCAIRFFVTVFKEAVGSIFLPAAQNHHINNYIGPDTSRFYKLIEPTGCD